MGLSPDPQTPVYVMGDVHGQFEKLICHLRAAGLVADDLSWAGEEARLWFMGDLFDRGPDGIACLDLVMRLQREASRRGGFVGCLLGNHDALLLSAYRFPNSPTTGPGHTFLEDWRLNGGVESDLRRLRPEHARWIARLPALAGEGDTLLVHADIPFYLRYGDSIESVNAAIGKLLQGADIARWDSFLEAFSEHRGFADFNPDGLARAREMLAVLGGERIVHAHSPIDKFVGRQALEITGPLVYAGGLCVNVDGGMYRGGPGFIYQLVPTE